MPWLLLLLYGVIVRWDYSIEKVISSQIFEFKLVAFSIAHACQTERAAEPPLGRLNPDSCTRFTFMSPETWAQLRCNSSALLCFRWEVTVSSRASFLWKPSFKVQRIGIAKLCHALNKESQNPADVREIRLVKTRIVGRALWYYCGGSRLLWWDMHPGYTQKFCCLLLLLQTEPPVWGKENS